MKPAERISLLKRLAKALDALNDEAEIDLVLRQFGFNTGTLYDDESLYTYALRMLENYGDDEKRLELERYLEPAADEPSPRPASNESGPWKSDGFRLFVSHPHSLAELAGAMRDSLARFRIEAFVAHDDIEPSEQWQEIIESALLTCHAAVALVTPDFRASKWCDQEIGFCIARSICVVPLLYGDVTPHGFLGSYQGIKMEQLSSSQRYGGYEASRRLMNALMNRPELKERMVPSIVRRYSNSNSFDNTREAVPLLRTIPDGLWTEELVAEAETAATENNQVYDANVDGERAPDVVKRILSTVVTAADFVAADPDIPFAAKEDIPF